MDVALATFSLSRFGPVGVKLRFVFQLDCILVETSVDTDTEIPQAMFLDIFKHTREGSVQQSFLEAILSTCLCFSECFWIEVRIVWVCHF